MPYAVCPACEEETYVSARLQEGDTVRCRNCRERLEVIDTDPVELDWPYDEEEYDDWEEVGAGADRGSSADQDADWDEDDESWDAEDDDEEEEESPMPQRRRAGR